MRLKLPGRLGLFLLLSTICSAFARVDVIEWPGWRGSAQTGVVEAPAFTFDARDGLRVAWKRPLGTGYSSVSVVRGHAVTLFGDGRDDYVVSLDPVRGREQWRYKLQSSFKAPIQSNDGPASTPAIAGTRVVALGPRGRLAVLDLETGHAVWTHDLVADFAADLPYFGFVSSPIVLERTVYLEASSKHGALLAFDLDTGRLRWAAGHDTVTYQTPVVATLDGQRQVVFAGDRLVFGVRPETGEVLWSHPHGVEADPEAVKQIVLGPGDLNPICPVIVGADGVLLSNYYAGGTVLFRVERRGDGYRVTEAWRNPNIRKTYTVPVVVGNYVFGFTNRFATCLDPRTGETMWRSRPPGDGWLIAVNDYLVYVTKDEGEVRVARATPRGYQDLGGAPALDGVTWTPPSYGQGLIFVRNFRDIAALEVVPGGGAAAAGSSAAAASSDHSVFGAFLARVAGLPLPERGPAVDAYLKSQPQFPIVEGDRTVHIVYKGSVHDIAVEGDMLDVGEQAAMTRIEGTDVYYATFDLEPDARIDYRISKDFRSAFVTDPLNPRKTAVPGGERSEIVMPRWTPPPYASVTPATRGTLERFDLASAAENRTRKIQVYLPPGYAASSERYPVLYGLDGADARQYGRLVDTLDALISTGRIRPIIAVLLDTVPFDDLAGPRRRQHADMLAGELVPRIDGAYRTAANPQARTLLGGDAAGFAAVYTALLHPEEFGSAAGQSAYLFGPVVGDDLLRLVNTTPRPNVRLFLSWGRYDVRGRGVQRRVGMMDWRKDGQDFVKLAAERGFDVKGRENDEGWGWSSWRNYTHVILEYYFARTDQLR